MWIWKGLASLKEQLIFAKMNLGQDHRLILDQSGKGGWDVKV